MELTEDNSPNVSENEAGGGDHETAEQKARKRRNPFKIQKDKEEKERRQKKRARLIVRNMSYKAKEEDLRKHFEQWGKLEEVNIPKRADGKLVGCAFVQYQTINQATKAILKGNGKEFLGRVIYIDWALGKDEYLAKKQQNVKEEPEDKKPKLEIKEEEEDDDEDGDGDDDDSNEEDDEDSDDDDEDENEDEENENDDDDDDDEDKKDIKSKLNIDKVNKEKRISNDVQEGCTVFIKNVPFDAEDQDLRKVCRKFGPVWYAIINREPVSGHSKGTAFVKFKTKESADMCLQSAAEFVLMDQVLEPYPALSREEIRQQNLEKDKKNDGKDSRNLYLAREGLIMANSKAAEGVSASDMNKRHKLEQIKAQVLKNLNRFVSRNRLSIHNLPLNYDNDNLRDMIIAYTGFHPHECRVMRENKITPDHPKGKSKGFGFMSFNTHLEALTALRKLNNNPKVFGTQHRPIVAFSIEDRAVHKVKEKRKERSKLNNPTFKDKLEKRKALKNDKKSGKQPLKTLPKGPQDDDKQKLKEHIKKLEESRAKKNNKQNNKKQEAPVAAEEEFVGTEAKKGTVLRMRSFKKLKEQSADHMQRVKQEKKKKRQEKIKQIHLAERKAEIRPKQGRKVEKDDLAPLVNKYKQMLEKQADPNATNTAKKPKRTKWYTE
ncbi:RNA-binding protein 28 [Musca vetustissima]|uniref:RNA-binding protein 28 n=1 Tax=Musca vetustissima TaxID=27455 RepID=UPI002AB62A53|nr:RNA-binding protein 28 [Musca vetustissima]